MDSLELAWEVIDHIVAKDYMSKAEAIEELGDLNELALSMSEVIEAQGLKLSDGMEYLVSQIDAELF